MKKKREEMDFLSFRKSSGAVTDLCMTLPEWQKARSVHVYVSAVNNEVDTLRLILTLLDRGKEVVVPKCIKGEPEIFNQKIASLDELMPCDYGLMEPEYDPAREISPGMFDLVIAPLLAFDRKGGRLGFGKGYYDRILKKCECRKVGLAYSFQEIELVPMDENDAYLDIIITEKEIIRVDAGL